MYLNRTLCSVLEEMRALDKTKNYSPLLGLIEEAQSMGNRMEAAIENKRDIRRYEAKRKEAYKAWLELKKKYDKLCAAAKKAGLDAPKLEDAYE